MNANLSAKGVDRLPFGEVEPWFSSRFPPIMRSLTVPVTLDQERRHIIPEQRLMATPHQKLILPLLA